MTTTPHDEALTAAVDALYGCNGNPLERRNIESAISAYLSSIGGVVVPRNMDVGMIGAWYRYKNGHRFHDEEPARDTSDVGAYQAMLAASPLHVPIPEAGNGDGWNDIASAPKTGRFLAMGAGSIDRLGPIDPAAVYTVKAHEGPFTCEGFYSDNGFEGFIDEFGEQYSPNGLIGEAEDLTAEDDILRLVSWRHLPSPPSINQGKQ